MVKATNMERRTRLLYLELNCGSFICIDIFHLLEAFRLDEDKIDFFGACNTLNILTYTIRLEIKNLVI